MNREWIDNAFWETPKKNILNAICEFDEGGRRVRQVMKMRRYDDNGDENPDFFECLNYLGEEKIEASTNERRKRKTAELEFEKNRKLEEQRARKLEKLFEYKLELFEIPEIKNTKHRKLRARLRRAQSIPEANIYAMYILTQELGLEDELKKAKK